MEEEARDFFYEAVLFLEERMVCAIDDIHWNDGERNRVSTIAHFLRWFAEQQVEKARKEWQNSIDRAHLTRDGDQEQKRKQEKRGEKA